MDTQLADELLGTICHDLRDPLASIVMGSSFLLRALPDESRSDRARRMAESIHRAAQRMNRLLGDYHELSRFERGLATLDVAEHDAAVLIAAASEPFRGPAGEADITVTTKEEGDVRVRCDGPRVVDALQKLVSNAVRAVHRGGRVVVGARRAGDRVELSVRDDGPGVPPDVLPHLFDYRWLATRRARNGAGLGLGLARWVATAHGGDLRYEPGRDAGSVFTLVLPG